MDLESALSLSEKIWHKRDIDEEKIAHIAKLYDISPLLARIIVIREIDENAIPSFLTPKLRDLLPDPLTLKDMDEAVLTIAQAIKDKASIAICGDYDADGISASALLKKYFDALGVETQIHLPDRLKDGYGLNHEAIDSIQKSDCHYMISVDCGAKDIEVLDKAHQQGLNIVILDHHPTSQKPPSRAFVNPNGADCQSGLGYLTAVGVAFIFLVGLSRHLRDNYGGQFDSELPDLMSWLDLVALGTICDVAPLIGVNRAFVVRGLEALARGDNIGLKALAEKINLSFPMNVESFSFAIGPHINAAGRIGHADLAFDLLVGKDEEKAKQMAAELHLLNRQRRAIESQILNEALARMRASEENASLKAGLVLSSKNWHAGVIGIVAARVKDLYQRPAAVISEAGEQSVGSARGDGVDLGAIMEEALARDLLIKGGGHKQAAGFTISADKIPAFSDFFAQACAEKKSNAPSSCQIDAILDFSDAHISLYRDLQKVAPFGKGNQAPAIAFTDGRLLYAKVSQAGHVMCRFEPAQGGRGVDVIAFRQAHTPLGKKLQNSIGEIFHILGSLRPHRYRRGAMIEIILEDAVRTATLKQIA